jgi:hypothetical protein
LLFPQGLIAGRVRLPPDQALRRRPAGVAGPEVQAALRSHRFVPRHRASRRRPLPEPSSPSLPAASITPITTPSTNASSSTNAIAMAIIIMIIGIASIMAIAIVVIMVIVLFFLLVLRAVLRFLFLRNLSSFVFSLPSFIPRTLLRPFPGAAHPRQGSGDELRLRLRPVTGPLDS